MYTYCIFVQFAIFTFLCFVPYILIAYVVLQALPTLCALTVDPNKDVRTHSFKTISQFLSKLEKASEDPEYASKIGKSLESVFLV